ncbi:hypothetical protein R6Q59_002131 [Mikania micrantha]
MEPLESSSSKFCNECKTSEFKYKCPGCSTRSCSLPCVKAHKQRTGCTGKRHQLTDFVPLSKFDDNLLLSDYNMLEDVKRIADSAKRRRLNLCGNYSGISFHLKNLLSAAKKRRIKLIFLPNGMSKRQTNKTSCNNSCKSITWTIEWRFHSTDIKIIDHEVHENSNIRSVIQKHLKPGSQNHSLKPFYLEPVDSLKFYISKHPKQPRSPFHELDINAPIRKQLSNLVIIEYPVIHVLLPSHNPDVKVIKAKVSQQVQPKTDPVNDSQPGPEGMFFKEEEIKDSESADPRVLDLTDKLNSKTETKDEGFVHKPISSTYHDNDLADLMNFGFEPELIDVYSSLISEANPDDFLDFDGLCDDLPSKEEDIKCEVIEEELEEGEIAGSD